MAQTTVDPANRARALYALLHSPDFWRSAKDAGLSAAELIGGNVPVALPMVGSVKMLGGVEPLLGMVKSAVPKSGVLQKMKQILYRAANEADVSFGKSLAEDIEDARAYLNNPGFGGSNLYRAETEVDPKRVLRVRANHADKEIAHILDEAGYHAGNAETAEYFTSRKIRNRQRIIENSYPSAGVMLAQEGKIAQELAKKYDWVVFTDDFPQGATTWTYLGQDNIPLKKIGGTRAPKAPPRPPEYSTREHFKQFYGHEYKPDSRSDSVDISMPDFLKSWDQEAVRRRLQYYETVKPKK